MLLQNLLLHNLSLHNLLHNLSLHNLPLHNLSLPNLQFPKRSLNHLPLRNLWNDARSYQIVFLALFLILGMVTRDWALQPSMVLIAIATCLLTQVGASLLFDRSFTLFLITREPDLNCLLSTARREALDKQFVLHLSGGSDISPFPKIHSDWLDRMRAAIPSALITALGLSLLLRVDRASTMMLASSIAIGSKFLLRVSGKHLFNPANVGIVAALTLTQDAWVSPGQWGEEAIYGLLFLGLGGIVLQRVGRWDTSVVFLVAYAGLEATRNLWLGWTWDVWAHRLMNGSLLLFALFMVTDPRTIPNSRIGRCIFAGSIAILTFVLRNYFYLSTAVFWSLFILSPLTFLLDFIFPSTQFSWFGGMDEPFSPQRHEEHREEYREAKKEAGLSPE